MIRGIISVSDSEIDLKVDKIIEKLKSSFRDTEISDASIREFIQS